MTGCARLSDRMISVAHGGQKWTAEERGHLTECPDCGAEWRLVRLVAELGPPAPVRSVEGVVGSVLARVREERRGSVTLRRSGWGRVALALAAAVLLAVALWRPLDRPGRSAPEPASFASELDGLSADELAVVLRAYPEAIDVVMPDGAAGLSDLSSDELETVLNSFEG